MADINKYISKRVDDQIKWHDNNSTKNKKKYIKIKTYCFIISSIITILTGLADIYI